MKSFLHGYLTGARKPVTLSQCVAAMLPATYRQDEIQRMIEDEILPHLSGTFEDATYLPPFYWSDRLQAVNDQLNTTGYISYAAFSEFQLSLERVKTCSDVVVVSSSSSAGNHNCFLVSSTIMKTLKAALRELRDEEKAEGEQWWLHVPSVCPPAMSADEDVAALLTLCLLELTTEDEGKADLVIAGVFAIHSDPVLRLRNALLEEIGNLQKVLQSVVKRDTDPMKLISKHWTKKHVIELLRKHIKQSVDVDNDDDSLFLSALYDHLQATMEQAFIAMVGHMTLQKGRSLILAPNQANRLQREGERDAIFQRHWLFLLLAVKALQPFIKSDQKEVLCIKHRCVTIASLLTSFVCWEHNIVIPSSLLAYFSTAQYPDGTIELDFDARMNLPPLLGLRTGDDSDDLVQLTKDDLKRLLKELPKECSLGVIEMWEILGSDDLSSSCSSFCSYLEFRANSTFRVITTRPDKKCEKQVIIGIKTELITILSVGHSQNSTDLMPLSLSSLPLIAMRESPSLELINYLVLFAYVEITGGTKGVLIPRPLLSIPVLTKLVNWLESLVNDESATKHPIERDLKLRAISSLQALLVHV